MPPKTGAERQRAYKDRMSKLGVTRVQAYAPNEEAQHFKRAAEEQGVTLNEWILRALRAAVVGGLALLLWG